MEKIWEYLKVYLDNFVAVFSELAPWLLIGYILAGVIALLLPQELVKKHLSGKGFLPILKAVLLGVPLPLCSCGIIPVAASIKDEGASRGATGAFFIATPQTGIDSIVVTWSMLGWVMAIFRPIFAFLTGMTSGLIIDKFCGGELKKVEEAEKATEEKHCCCCCHSHKQTETVTTKKSFASSINFIFNYGFGKMLKSTSPSLLVGILLAALIQTVVPADFGASYLNDNMALEFVIVILIAIPLYVCSSASVPVALTLFLKGFSPGAVLIFLVAGPATNTVSIAAMRSMLGNKATILSMIVIAFWAIVAGVLINLLGVEIPNSQIFNHVHESGCCGGNHYVKIAASIIMGLLMLNSLRLKYFSK